jgi:hypothetical protein
MLLLITGCNRAKECADELTRVTRLRVELAESLVKAAALTRRKDYQAIIVEHWLAEADTRLWEEVLANSGAMPVYVNMAVTGKERLVRDVQNALKRQQQTRLLAMKSAEGTLRSELREAITAILLNSELALAADELPITVQGKLQAVYGAAQRLRSRFETVQ